MKLFNTVILLVFLVSCGTESSQTFTLITESIPSEGGTISYSPQGSSYDRGTIITVEAIPNDHYTFSRWEGDLSGSDNPTELYVIDNHTISGVFQKKSYPLTVNIVGSGSVEEELITTKSTDYQHGSTVLLKAIPDDGWKLDFFSDNVQMSNSSTGTTVVDQPTVVTVHFSRISYSVGVEVIGKGSYTINGLKNIDDSIHTYPEGTSVKIESENDSLFWFFSSWKGDIESNERIVEFELRDDITIDLIFEETEPSLMDIDGNYYRTRIINGSEYMIENLRTSRFSDGTELVYFDDYTLTWNNSNKDYVYVEGYSKSLPVHSGYLYNRPTILSEKNICPSGWKIVDEEGYSNLLLNLDPDNFFYHPKKFMSKSYWSPHYTENTNDTGFSLLPNKYASLRYMTTSERNLGNSGSFIYVTQGSCFGDDGRCSNDITNGKVFYFFSLNYEEITAQGYPGYQTPDSMFPIRCMKN